MKKTIAACALVCLALTAGAAVAAERGAPSTGS